MSNITYHFSGDDPAVQREAVDLLARCFGVWAERREIFKGRFPFREQSFVARNRTGELVGHLGIIPFEIQTGNDSTVAAAGVASVAVAPEYRKCGIAGMLCQTASTWAESCGFSAMPLYTSAFRVYEKNGWKLSAHNGCLMQIPAELPTDTQWKCGEELSEKEQETVIALYQKCRNIAGWVVRTFDDYDAVSWQRLFGKANCRWQIFDSGYALSVDGVIAEICGDIPDNLCGAEQAFLAADDPRCAGLKRYNWKDISGNYPLPPGWEGEAVMNKVFSDNQVWEKAFFPLAHKF